MNAITSLPPVTPDDLLKMPDGDQYELVDGQLVEKNMSYWSGYVGGQIQRRLALHSEMHGLGWVNGDAASFRCFPRDAQAVRKPDASFIQLERLSPEQAMTEGHLSIAPDLVVEVISPNDASDLVDAKVQDYLDAGVRLVWVIHPVTRMVEVHRGNGTSTFRRADDLLEGEDVVPGFRCLVKELFRPPSKRPAS